MGLGIAFRAFSAALFNKQASERIRQALQPETSQEAEPKLLPKAEPKPTAPSKPVVTKPVRSDAITLLSALQREARFVDLIQEDLTKFADAQVGAAARPCLQQCASTLARFFDLAPVSDVGEGSQLDVGEDGSPERYQWIGEGSGNQGQLVHHGWHATRLDLPEWTGQDADARVVAPAQVKR